MRINHNLMAMNTHRQLGINNASASKSVEKLSSGYRINRAGDDAAGLAISEKMRSQIRGLNQASRNAQDGISLIQTAEGALNESHDILQRMRELSVQAATATNTNDDKAEIQKEVVQLKGELDRIAKTTQFNTMNLLDGSGAVKLDEDTATSTLLKDASFESISFSGLGAETWTLAARGDHGYTLTGGTSGTVLTSDIPAATTAGTISFGGPNGESVEIKVNNAYAEDGLDTLAFAVTGNGGFKLHIGANTNQSLDVTIGDMRVNGGTNTDITDVAAIDVSTADGANDAIQTVDAAIKAVSSTRSSLGAVQNRLEHTIKNLDTSAENLQASESRIRDVDMAKEMMKFTKDNILKQAAQAMLAQANQAPQGVLQLLR